MQGVAFVKIFGYIITKIFSGEMVFIFNIGYPWYVFSHEADCPIAEACNA